MADRTTAGGITLPSPQLRDVTGTLIQSLGDIAMLIAGEVQVNVAGSGTLDLTADQCRARVVRLIGSPSAGRVVRWPLAYAPCDIIFHNATGGGVAVTVRTTSESSGGVSVPDGQNRHVVVSAAGTKQINT